MSHPCDLCKYLGSGISQTFRYNVNRSHAGQPYVGQLSRPHFKRNSTAVTYWAWSNRLLGGWNWKCTGACNHFFFIITFCLICASGGNIHLKENYLYKIWSLEEMHDFITAVVRINGRRHSVFTALVLQWALKWVWMLWRHTSGPCVCVYDAYLPSISAITHYE